MSRIDQVGGFEPMDIALAEALWRLKELPVSRVADVAVAALEAGFDGPALRELAWGHESWADIGGLFQQALQEMGRPEISMDEAIARLVREQAARIVQGDVEPVTGARDLFYRVWHHIRGIDGYESVMDFLRWANEADYYTENGEAMKAKIVRRAKDLMEMDPISLSRAVPGWKGIPGAHGRPLSVDDAILLVLDEAPEFQARWSGARNDWYCEAMPEPVDRAIGPFMSELARYVGESLLHGRVDEATALLAIIERLMSHGDEVVRTAAATNFLEGLLHRADLEAATYVHLLGASSVAYIKAWDEFTGVRTPGL